MASYANGWTSNMENFHLQCVQKSQGYAWMHFQASAFYNKLYLGLMIPCCILNVLVGSAGLASISSIIGDPLWYLLLSIFIINILVGALGAVNGLLQPNLTSFQHRQLATEFVHLVRKLQAELLIEPERRIDCDDFGEMVNLEYENLLKNDMCVPSHIVHKFERSVNSTTAMPEMILERGMRRDIFLAGTPRQQPGNTVPVTSQQFPPSTPIRRKASEPNPGTTGLPSSGSSSARVGASWMTAFCAVQRARKGSVRPPDAPVSFRDDMVIPCGGEGLQANTRLDSVRVDAIV